MFEEGYGMPLSEGIMVALFCVGMVFALLTSVFLLIKLTSAVVLRLSREA